MSRFTSSAPYLILLKIIKGNNTGGSYHTPFIIEMRKQYTVLIGKSSRQKHTESPTYTPDSNIKIGLTEADGRMTSKLIGSGQAPVIGRCKHRNESVGYLLQKWGFLNYLIDYQVLKKASVSSSWSVGWFVG
jgi:hypothetical protein